VPPPDNSRSKAAFTRAVIITHMYKVPDAVPLIHAVSSHVATDKDPPQVPVYF